MDATALVADRVELPFVPVCLQEMVLEQCVQLVSVELTKQLTPQQQRKVSDHLAGMADGISYEERNQLVTRIARRMGVVPLVPMTMREAVAGVVIDVLLGLSSVSAVAGGIVGSAVSGSATSLLSGEGRKCLATRINDVVDIPGLSVDAEQATFQTCLDMFGSGLDSLVPPEWRRALKGASRAEVEAFKGQVVIILDDKTPVPFIDSAKKQLLIRTVVDFAFDSFLDVSGLDGVVLSPKAQLDRLVQDETEMQAELSSLRRCAARRQAALERRITRIREQQQELRKEMGGSSGALRISALALGAAATAMAGVVLCCR